LLSKYPIVSALSQHLHRAQNFFCHIHDSLNTAIWLDMCRVTQVFPRSWQQAIRARRLLVLLIIKETAHQNRYTETYAALPTVAAKETSKKHRRIIATWISPTKLCLGPINVRPRDHRSHLAHRLQADNVTHKDPPQMSVVLSYEWRRLVCQAVFQTDSRNCVRLCPAQVTTACFPQSLTHCFNL
jgi:hypothetical protein